MSLLSRAKKAIKQKEEKPKTAEKAAAPKKTEDTAVADAPMQTSGVSMAQAIGLTAMLTEKGMHQQEKNVAVFKVKPGTSKGQIQQAIYEEFGVRPISVRTARFLGKHRRRGTHVGMTPAWKKAYVKVEDVSKLVTEEE